MISSGIKRGLAASAISALAIAGIPALASTAFATSVSDQTAANSTTVYSQFSKTIAPQNDGVNTTAHLLATGGAGVTSVQFQYQPVAAQTTNGVTTYVASSRMSGLFVTAWSDTPNFNFDTWYDPVDPWSRASPNAGRNLNGANQGIAGDHLDWAKGDNGGGILNRTRYDLARGPAIVWINAGTNSISGYAVASDGSIALLDAGGKTASAAAGVTDLADSLDSRFVYARLGNGTVGAYAVDPVDGGLTPLPVAAGLPAGAAGIAAR